MPQQQLPSNRGVSKSKQVWQRVNNLNEVSDKSVLAIKLISEAHGRLLCNIKGLASNHQIYIGQVRQSLQAIEAYNSRPGLKAGLIRAYSYKTR